jgi:hypothetical protein
MKKFINALFLPFGILLFLIIYFGLVITCKLKTVKHAFLVMAFCSCSVLNEYSDKNSMDDVLYNVHTVTIDSCQTKGKRFKYYSTSEDYCIIFFSKNQYTGTIVFNDTLFWDAQILKK